MIIGFVTFKAKFFLSFKNRKKTEENIESTNIGRISQNKLIENSINY
jgi:hypothetical protein